MEVKTKIEEHFKSINVSLNKREFMIAKIGYRIGERDVSHEEDVV